jgi:Domain of unknown function (DUF4389)
VATPVHVRIEYRERRSRLTTAPRLVLVLPHLVAALVLGLVATMAVAATWVWILATGRFPAPLARLVAGTVRYTARVGCYWLLVTEPYPRFSLSRGERDPVDVWVDEPARRSRLTTLLRLPLALPALAILYFLGILALVLAFAAWWTILVRGRLPHGIFEVMALCHRYQARVSAYAWLLVDAYPWFEEEPGSAAGGWGIQAEVWPAPE